MGLTWVQITFEALKLAAQFGGALFIARKAVQWALNRYKSEKHWERKLQAYTDLLAAIGAIKEVLDVWETWELFRSKPTEEMQKEYRIRYWAAKQKLQEAIGVAGLLLPGEIARLLTDLNNELRKKTQESDSWMEAIATESAILSKLQQQVLQVGKADLDIGTTTGTIRAKT